MYLTNLILLFYKIIENITTINLKKIENLGDVTNFWTFYYKYGMIDKINYGRICNE